MDRARILADGFQIRHTAKVHQMIRRGQPQFHERDEAHAAGQDFSVSTRQQRQRLFQIVGRGVFEILRNHA